MPPESRIKEKMDLDIQYQLNYKAEFVNQKYEMEDIAKHPCTITAGKMDPRMISIPRSA